MPTENEGTTEALTAHLQRMSESVEQLSARIARLATILGVDLQNDSEIHRVLNIDGGAPGGYERRRSASQPPGPERRKSNQQEELRALYWSTRKIRWSSMALSQALQALMYAVCLTPLNFLFLALSCLCQQKRCHRAWLFWSF